MYGFKDIAWKSKSWNIAQSSLSASCRFSHTSCRYPSYTSENLLSVVPQSTIIPARIVAHQLCGLFLWYSPDSFHYAPENPPTFCHNLWVTNTWWIQPQSPLRFSFRYLFLLRSVPKRTHYYPCSCPLAAARGFLLGCKQDKYILVPRNAESKMLPRL